MSGNGSDKYKGDGKKTNGDYGISFESDLNEFRGRCYYALLEPSTEGEPH